MWPDPQEIGDLVTFTEEMLNGKLHFLYSDRISSNLHLVNITWFFGLTPWNTDFMQKLKRKISQSFYLISLLGNTEVFATWKILIFNANSQSKRDVITRFLLYNFEKICCHHFYIQFLGILVRCNYFPAPPPIEGDSNICRTVWSFSHRNILTPLSLNASCRLPAHAQIAAFQYHS